MTPERIAELRYLVKEGGNWANRDMVAELLDALADMQREQDALLETIHGLQDSMLRAEERALIAEAEEELREASPSYPTRVEGEPETSEQAALSAAIDAHDRDVDALRMAIRRFTVEIPNDANGPTEAALMRLQSALGLADVPAAREEFCELCSALADDTQALREAADKVFGEDFRAPVTASCDGDHSEPRCADRQCWRGEP